MNEPIPDVEALITQIRAAVREAGADPDDPQKNKAADPDDLYENLRLLNEAHLVGQSRGRGLRHRFGRFLFRCLAPVPSEINAVHVRLVRILNRLVMALDGRDTITAGELLKRTRQRQDLMALLSDRLAELERRVQALEQSSTGPCDAASVADAPRQ